MSVKLATTDMIPSLTALWLDAFPGDSAEDAHRFFDHIFVHEPQDSSQDEQCFVWWQDEQPVSMMFLLPAQGNFAGEPPLSLRYVYAAATLTSYRGQGIFHRLLNEVHQRLDKRGIDACFLRPAEPSLFDYYARFGYETFFYVKEDALTVNAHPAARHQAAVSSNVDAVALTETRNSLLASCPAWVEWPSKWIAYAAEQAVMLGGRVMADCQSFVICEPMEHTVRAREWLGSLHEERRLLQEIAGFYPSAATIERRQPAGVHDEATSFGMLCPLSEKAKRIISEHRLRWESPSSSAAQLPYMGLAFD